MRRSVDFRETLNIWEGTRPHQFNEDIGQGWLGQLETADDAAVVQRGLYDHVGVDVSRELHFDIVLPAFRDLHARQLLQPACLWIVVEFEAGHMAPGLSFDLAYAALDNALPLIDNHEILAQFL